MSTKKDVVEEPSDLTPIHDAVGVVMAREGDVLSKWLSIESENTDVDPMAVYEAIITEIMGSESALDVLNLPEPSDLVDHADRVLELHGYRVLDSEFEVGAPVYFVLGATDMTSGEKVVITCGEQAIMAQLLRLNQLKAFPIRVIPQKSKRPNRFGRHPMRLRAAG